MTDFTTDYDLPEIKLDETNYINRELSTVDFNRRVLALAQDRSVPLLERIKFAAIVGNNLDEFYMVRVASHVQKVKLGLQSKRPDGLTPTQLLNALRTRANALMTDHRDTINHLLHELEQHNIAIHAVDHLSTIQQEALRAYFREEVFPVLTPLAADHARPFPFISNLSMNLGVYLQRRQSEDGMLEFVRIKVPEALPRLVNLGKHVAKYADLRDSLDQFVWIEDVIAHNLDLLFPGMEILEHFPFRVTRNADIDYEHEKEEEMLDLSAIIEASVRERRFGSVVRLSVPEDISDGMLERLIYELGVDPERDVYRLNGALGAASLFELAGVDRPDLKYASHVPKMPEALPQNANIFANIRENDVLVHHPYDSFMPVEEFFRQAARDPHVLAIKATLYRVGKDSPVVKALMEARENNKQVAVLVELKARFDEENNLEWTRQLEHQGVHVTYGVEELAVKTHAKIALVVRKEGDSLRRYVHLGTGNYNSSTARLYTDLGLFTAHPQLGEDASRLFNRLTGYAPETTYKRLLVAPEFLLPTLLDLIDNEIEHALRGEPARLVFKMNQLEEDAMIQKLYMASQAGVQIDLIVRGLCCLRVGIPGVSDNIRVRSILGRFLEHPRIYYFRNAPQEHRIYAGSADLMRRNLHNRVETVFPVLDLRLQNKIQRILATDLRCNTFAWAMHADGRYYRVEPGEDDPLIDSQYIFMQDSAGLDIRLD